jgi:2-polyprenyl-6-methoxyphenol hydroxylase-like FAD-dependent oxidoreductase
MHDPIAPARVDVVVVGARAAGAATSMLLARSGLDVLAVDRGGYGTDTLSTHALMRGGVLQLARWGLLDRIRDAGTPIVRRSTFHYAGQSVPVEIKAKDGIDGLYAPRRTLLDAMLVDAAREAGATVLHGTRLAGLSRSPDGRVRGVELERSAGRRLSVRADWVVGADGVRSTVARAVGAPIRRSARHWTGTVYGHYQGLEADGYEWLYVPGASTGLIPTDGGAACVFATVPQRRFREQIAPDVRAGYARVLEEVSPGLARAVALARRLEPLRGFPGQAGFLRQAWGPGWALVGDAGYFKDPITAHGITDALRDAELLARAIASGRESALAAYEEERDALSTALLDLTDAVASFEWSLDTLQELHRLLSEPMKHEVRALLALGEVPQSRSRRTA